MQRPEDVRTGRFLFLNTRLSGALGLDDRIRSDLFHGQRNGAEGYRVWKNVGGFSWIREYQDFPPGAINAAGLAGDKRMAVVAIRALEGTSNVAEQLGVPKVMEFYPVQDDESKLSLTGVTWQEQGTGDTFLSVAILFGTGVGNQGGAPGSVTDNAGLVLCAN